MAKPITSAERQYLDYLRRKGVQTSNGYVRRLVTLRSKEVKRICDKLLREYADTSAWADAVRMGLTEPYLADWYKGLIVNGGLPMVAGTARQLTGNPKALTDMTPFRRGLADYAEVRAGSEIKIVSGTFKDGIIATIRREIDADYNIGVERLARAIKEDFDGVKLWQARRIAQTELLNGMAEAGREAAQALDIPFTKQWCCSGLGNTRESHLAMDGVEVDQYEYFQLAGGAMLYPHDTSGGADASEIINCCCSLIRRPK